MNSKITAMITAVGGYVPEDRLTNADLEKLVDTNDEWIRSRTGIEERRILKGEGMGASEMVVPAVQELLKKRGMDALEIDCIICATVTGDLVFPATANIVSDLIGAKNAFGFDLNAACSGFLYGLTLGASLIESGRYQKVLLVGVDKMSSIIDYQDRATCIIFGDGAGAVLLEPNFEGHGVLDSVLKSDGHGRHALHMKAGGSKLPPSLDTVNQKQHYVFQDGATVFKAAVKGMSEASSELLSRNQLTPHDLTWLVPHQANARIIDSTAERLGVPPEKVMKNLQRFGNTTAATLPLCLWEWEPKLKKGDLLLLAAFGGGFTWGATLVRWGYRPNSSR